MVVYDLHRDWAWVMIVANALVGAWAIGAHSDHRLRVKALWWCTAAAQATVLVQVVLGVILVNRYDYPLPHLHALYGFSAIIAAAIIYSYRLQLRHRLYLLYGCGGLFIMGLGIRALFLEGR